MERRRKRGNTKKEAHKRKNELKSLQLTWLLFVVLVVRQESDDVRCQRSGAWLTVVSAFPVTPGTRKWAMPKPRLNRPFDLAVEASTSSQTPADTNTTTSIDIDDVSSTSTSSFDYNPAGDWTRTPKYFHMDLSNLALADPWQAADAVAVWQGTPNLATYAIVADGFCHHGQPAAAEEWILGGVEDEGKWKRLLFPNSSNGSTSTSSSNSNSGSSSQAQAAIVSSTYMGLLTAWANFQPSTGYGARRAEALVRRLMDLHGLSMTSSGSSSSTNSTTMSASTSRLLWVKCWTIVLEAWCKRVPSCSLSHAERVLHTMEQQGSSIQPNLLTYTSFIVGLAQSRRVDAARTAQRILDTTIGSENADLVAYTAVMNAWAKATSRVERRQAATAVMRLLERIEGPSTEEEKETEDAPDAAAYQQQRFALNPIVYATAIAAIGNTWVDDYPNNDKDATYYADLAASLVPRMRLQGVTPVTETYNTLLHAYGNLSPSLFAQRAWEILCDQVPHPTVRTWSAVLRASRGDAPTAASVLEAMEVAYYGADGTGKEIGSSPQPNTVCYTTVMGAWGKSSASNALEKIEALLDKLEGLYETTLSLDLRPTPITYLTYIDAIVRRNPSEAAELVTAVVSRMRQLHESGKGYVAPTRAIFNALMQAWSVTGRPDAPRRVEQIFHWMERKYQDGSNDLRPDENSLCATLNAWANQAEYGGADRAVRIWQHTQSLSDEERGFEPSVAVPNIVIKALARSKDPQGVVKAEQVLIELENAFAKGQASLRPDVRTYSSVINACAYCSGGPSERREALVIAVRTFRKMGKSNSSTAPNAVTYGTLLKAVNNLMPVSAERDNLVQLFFQRCCKEGCVGSFVISQLRLVSPELYLEVTRGVGAFSNKNTVLRQLPVSWTKNRID